MRINKTVLVALLALSGATAQAATSSESAIPAVTKYKAGNYAVIQNSTDSWNDSVVRISDVFEDGSVRVRFPDGTKAFVRKENVEANLSPEVPCIVSHNTRICQGDKVYYPAQATSLMIPEAPAEHLFADGKVEITTGLHHVYTVDQVGKEVQCSPQKQSVCQGDYVIANGYKESRPFTFEGTLAKVYSNGTVIVHSSYFWNYPVNVMGVVKRVASDDSETSGAVISSRSVSEKVPSAPVTTEVPTGSYDPFAEQVQSAQ